MPGPFYARYVPPKASTASSPVATQKASPPPPSSSDPAPAPAVEKREKRSNKRKRADAPNAAGNPDDAALKKHRSVLSKFAKSTKIAERLKAREQPDEESELPEEPELHGKSDNLQAILIPESIPDAPYEPKFSSLPSWLTEPVAAPANATKPFDELNIDPRLVRHLKSKGYNEAFAVQSSVLPLLLPGAPASIADVCVSAATGSGKTLAYLLPMIESIRHRVVTKLRGIVIVPTRELVTQVREAAELCAAGSGLKIGTAMGNHAFSAEQSMLIKKGKKYDPDAWRRLYAKAEDWLLNGWSKDSDHAEDVLDLLPGHVPQYESKVDILICTPGRLVEHVQNTKGFYLDDVDWLVIDEADRLLDQSFQGWAETVMKALEKEKPLEEMSAQERILSSMWYAPRKRHVKKVILSATMTRDLSKLSVLKLRRPTLVVAEGSEGPDGYVAQGEVYDMPPTLDECTIPVGDGSQKPLFLLHLLQNRILWDFEASEGQNREHMGDRAQSESSDSSSDTDSSSGSSDDSSSIISSTPEDLDSDGSESEADPSSDSESSESSESDASTSSIAGQGEVATPAREVSNSTAEAVSNVLIFTHNNENANRLSRLLSLLCPSYKGVIGTLTKSSTTAASRKVLHAFRASKLRILIASDRASRGLDLPNLAHIVNYDIPTSVTSYVHRAGRTARAGAYGVAWTFLTKSEAGWFWNVVARGDGIRRGGKKVNRMKLEDAVTHETREMYERALETLKGEVRGGDAN
ncbi:atp-dependent rna helicase dbp6 [Diplodia corticola]|uniref:ATP-dependent RNA helicase n=1 Tax=Diplodia corticola TaxID=236234 RepID=A0A1J9S4L4_9PEZI|nr:atp-dependent rna helicase dbp6 [Diplodia corticola]OJD34573.1 atp-dependent rna helicase dbp6 [Diplodia corticola]